jgi:biotin carboxyl carrier protein
VTADGVVVEGELHVVSVEGDGRWRQARVDGVQRRVAVVPDPDQRGAFTLQSGPVEVQVAPWRAASAAPESDPGELRAPMAGRVMAVLAAVGDVVEEGQAIVSMEAMKIETTLRAGRPGVVATLAVEQGDVVASGQLLVALEEEA